MKAPPALVVVEGCAWRRNETMTLPTTGSWLAAAVGASLLSAAVSVVGGALGPYIRRLSFPLLGLSAIASVAAGLPHLTGGPEFVARLPIGLPWLQWHVRVDALAGFFLPLIGLILFVVSLFGPGYTSEYRRRGHYSLAVLGVATGLFVAGMQLVVVADDALAFMVAWELMSVASYVLVAFEHFSGANRRAAFLYLLMAQLGAGMILLGFGVFATFAGDFSFAAMRAAQLPGAWGSIAFALALLGFGMKAGLVPMHVWLPEAHPAAPSHISALMSGVMLKVAVYGFIRFVFDLIGAPLWQWGAVLLLVGSVSALYGVLYALMQHDLKRLLAYHSVENIGIIFIGLGLSVLFLASGLPKLGALGLVAALYHTINHAVFKSLLFLGAGVIAQRGHERDLEHMGGLIRRMPWTAAFFLIGCISIAALPPFNGFVSEWLTFQTALQAAALESGVLRAVVPIAAAMLALTGALAAACFVKVYGVAFLGRPRGRRVRHAHEASPAMVAGQGVLALACVLLGVLPTGVIVALGTVSQSLTGENLASASSQGWFWLTPVAPQVASYSAPLVLFGVAGSLALWGTVYVLLRRRRKSTPVRRGDPWDCGFGSVTARNQYTSGAFSMPIRTVFGPLFLEDEQSERHLHEQLPTRATRLAYHLHVSDIARAYLYQPFERLIAWSARRVARIQTGRLRHYLAYSFTTLLLLLWLVT